MVLTRPAEAFSVMKREGGLGEPLIYALIGGSVGGIVSALFSLGFQSIGLFADKNNSLAAMTGMGIGFGRNDYLVASVPRDFSFYLECARASLFDDRWRCQPTV